VGDGQTGGIADGSFDDPSRWQAERVEIVDGGATFVSEGDGDLCELGVLEQTLQMPKREDAEPLVLTLDAVTNCTADSPDDCPPLLVEFGNSVARVRVPGGPSGSARSVHLCLGDAAFGADVRFRIRPGLAHEQWNVAFSCSSDHWPKLTGVRIRTAEDGECPPDGGIWNGDFASERGWSLQGASIGNGALDLNAGSATTHMAFPSAFYVAAPALRFNKAEGEVGIRLDGLQWTWLTANLSTTSGAHTICLPSFARGAVHEITFTGEATLRDLRFATEAQCGDGAFDEGFDRALSTGSWYMNRTIDAVSSIQAHSGNTAVRTVVGTTGQLRGIDRVPVAQPGAGHPAFRFWRRVDAAGQAAGYRLWGFGKIVPDTRFDNLSWEQTPLCQGHAWEGQLVPFELTLAPWLSGGMAGSAGSLAWVDDAGVALTTACE
jgi:hypothetical protein